jgi:hypothetical protein
MSLRSHKKRFILALVAALLPLGAVAQTNFATLTTDGAWTWYNDSRAIFHRGKLYFGFVCAADSKSTLSVLDLASGGVTNLWSAGFTQLDDHNNPGLVAKTDGTLLAVYSRHLADQYFSYRTSTSTNPVTPAGWNSELSIAASGASMTYANPFQLAVEGGKIFNFCRNQNFNPTVFTSTDGGTNWSAPQLFIQTGTGGSIRPYVKYSSNGTNRIDFLYTDGHPRDVANSLYHLFYTNSAFYKTDGTLVKDFSALPILHDSGERGSVIYQYSAAAQSDPNEWIPTGRAWCWETASQTNGAPVCVFTVQRDNVTGPTNGTDDRIYYYYARWTGASWQKRFIAQAGRPLYGAEDDYAGGICVDPAEPNIIYISSNAQNPFNLADTTNVTLSASQRYELWRGVTSDGGLTFAWSPITSNSAVDNLRPYIPRRNGGERCVLWFRGSYATYSSYACSIVGLFTSAVGGTSTLPAPAPLIYLDATAGVGGNTTLANGSTFTTPTNGTTGADNNWEQRTMFGSGGTVLEAGGENVTENAPEIRTTISGLVPGATYRVYANFWDASGTTENWNLRAGFTAKPGANPLYAAADATGALGATAAVLSSSQTYTSAPPSFTEANRVLLAAALGTTTANASGQIRVYLDDLPTSLDVNRRSWFDGVSYAPVTAAYSTNITVMQSGNQLVLSWPLTHLGWRLEMQTNGLGTNWFNVSNASATNQLSLPVSLQNSQVFYRLAYP